MKVTVTGATGTLGRATIPILHKAGHSVRALVRTPARPDGRPSDERTEVASVDLLDRGSVAEAVEDTDAVIHCVDLPPREYQRSFDIARHLLESIAPGAQFIFPTNVWAYGPPQTPRITVDHPKGSPARLGALRADLEKAILSQGGTPIHLPDVYGPGVERGWVGALFRSALRGQPIRVPGDPMRKVELLYVEDAARALIAPLGRITTRGREFTASGPRPIALTDLVSLIAQASGEPSVLRPRRIATWRFIQWTRPSTRPLVELSYLFEHESLLDGERIRQELAFRPEIDYAEGVRRTVRWWRQQDR